VSERLTKAMRLRRRREFLAVQSTGAKVSARHFLALATRRGATDSPGRVGFTVTRRVGNAVTRNRIKRLARDWLRRHGWVPAGWDVVIIAKDSAAGLHHAAELASDMARIQRTLGC
jgi:ribonuclease P protein component